MHELAFADAARPTPVVVLNLPLAEYSIGHELLLLPRRNALAMSTPEDFAQLDFTTQLHAIREAVWLCSDAFSIRDQFERPARIMWGFRWNEWKRRRWVKRLGDLMPEDYALAEAEFRNYLAASHPPVPGPGKHAMDVLYGDEEKPGRSLGQPMLLSLYQFVITLPASERPPCAWDFPFAKATWMFFAHMESLGNYRIENFEEREEQAVMDEARASARKSKVQSPESKVGDATGLATVPPDLSGDGGEVAEHRTPNIELRTPNESGSARCAAGEADPEVGAPVAVRKDLSTLNSQLSTGPEGPQ